MGRNVATPTRKAKSGHSRIRNQKPQIRNQISPVMQKVKSLLPQQKAAIHLNILTDWPLSTCQKLLSGERHENGDHITDLLRSKFGKEVLFVVMGQAKPEWFSKYQKQLDVIDAHRQLKETAKKVDEIRAEVFQ